MAVFSETNNLTITPGITEGNCFDTDNGATDSYGDACEEYYASPHWCDSANNYDDGDFSSGDMCCSCGGGTGLGAPNLGTWFIII